MTRLQEILEQYGIGTFREILKQVSGKSRKVLDDFLRKVSKYWVDGKNVSNETYFNKIFGSFRANVSKIFTKI